MAAPKYKTDLQDMSLAESTTGWAELTLHTSGSAPADETENFIQGSQAVSQTTGSKTGITCGMEFDYGSAISWTSGWVFLAWMQYAPGTAIYPYEGDSSGDSGGLRMGIGSTSGNMNFWVVGGSDFGRNPYGGWGNYAVDPEQPADYVDGSPVAGSYRIFGSLPNILSAITKGYPHAVDAIRFGRAEIRATGGNDSSADRCNFAGMAAENDYYLNRWGLFQYQYGAYLWKGLMSLGRQNDSSSASEDSVDFFDQNVVIFIDDSPKTYRSFNKIEINDPASIVDLTNVTIISLCTVSPGQFEMIDEADVLLTGCSFIDMDTFVFLPGAVVTNCIFQGCDEIDGGGGSFVGSTVQNSAVDMAGDSSSALLDKAAFVWDVATNPDGYLDDMTFVKGDTTHHAIEFGLNSPTTMTIRNMVTSGYSASNGQDDSTFWIRRTSGTVTINVVGGSGNFSYKSDGATVVVNTGKTLTLTGIEADSEVTIMKAGDDSSAAELHHTESVGSAGDDVFSYDASLAGTLVDILIMHLDFEPFLLENYTLPAADSSLPVSQVEDRVYENP